EAEVGVVGRVVGELNAGRGAREAGESEQAVKFLRQLGLLTAKPILYAANVNEDDLASGGGKWLDLLRAAVQAHHEEAEIVPFSAKFEAELGELSGNERTEYLARYSVRSFPDSSPSSASNLAEKGTISASSWCACTAARSRSSHFPPPEARSSSFPFDIGGAAGSVTVGV